MADLKVISMARLMRSRKGQPVIHFDWSKFANDYTTETTLHGFKELNETHSRLWKILWISVLLTSSAVAAYLIYCGITNYLATPVSTTITVSPMANFDLPILYCPRKWIDSDQVIQLQITPDVLAYALSYLCGLSQPDALSLGELYPHIEPPYINSTNLNEIKGKFDAFLKTHSFKDAFDLLLNVSINSNSLKVFKLVRSYSDYVFYSSYRINQIPVGNVMTGMGMCFRATLPVSESKSELYQRNTLDLLTTTNEMGFSLEYDKPFTRVGVESKHGSNDLLYIGDQARAFIPDSASAIPIQSEGGDAVVTVKGIQNYTRVNRQSQPCRITTVSGGYYSQQECEQECYTLSKRGCQPLGLNVLVFNDNTCHYGAKFQPRNDSQNFVACLEYCYLPCQEATRSFQIEQPVSILLQEQVPQEQVRKRQIIDEVTADFQIFNNNSDETQFAGGPIVPITFTRTIVVVVSRTVVSTIETTSFTWDTLVGIIGGQLGLWLGGSILSLFQLIYYFLRSCRKKKMNQNGSLATMGV